MLDFGYYNMDCMIGMKEFPDKYFDLAVVDPPYGSEGGGFKNPTRFGGDKSRFERYKQPVENTEFVNHAYGGRFERYNQDDNYIENEQHLKSIGWDIAPTEEYFDELFRVSKEQIIWGGNYFYLPPNRCFLIWYKTSIPEDFSMAMAEYAWCSFNSNAKVFSRQSNGQEERFHPTQKPVDLYTWIFKNYAKPGDKILDTHVGSASSLIAAHDAGLPYVGFEIDEYYYKLSKERLQKHINQMTIYDII